MSNKKANSTGQSILSELLSPQEWARVRKPVISSFIIFHGLLNYCFMFNNHPYINNINHFFFGYYAFMGLDQSWNVFAPAPRDTNPHLTATITYADGTTRLWTAPRMERLDFLTKIPKERYRKFFDDNALFSMPVLWPEIARYVARISYDDSTNPPVIVSLTRYWSRILPVETGIHKPNLPQSERASLIVYTVQPEDLAGVKAK